MYADADRKPCLYAAVVGTELEWVFDMDCDGVVEESDACWGNGGEDDDCNGEFDLDGSGSGGPAFSTWDTPGGTDPVADVPYDTLQLIVASGDPLTIVGADNPESVTFGFGIPEEARGDLMARGTNDWTRLPIGTTGYFLSSNGTDPVWAPVPGGVSGSGLSTQLAFWTGPTSLAGDVEATYNSSTDTLGVGALTTAGGDAERYIEGAENTTDPAAASSTSVRLYAKGDAWYQRTEGGAGGVISKIVTDSVTGDLTFSGAGAGTAVIKDDAVQASDLDTTNTGSGGNCLTLGAGDQMTWAACGTGGGDWAVGLDYDKNGTNPYVSLNRGNVRVNIDANEDGNPDSWIGISGGQATISTTTFTGGYLTMTSSTSEIGMTDSAKKLIINGGTQGGNLGARILLYGSDHGPTTRGRVEIIPSQTSTPAVTIDDSANYITLDPDAGGATLGYTFQPDTCADEEVLTYDADGTAGVYCKPATGVTGGVGAGDVQYRVDGTTFGGEAAFNYDAATNILKSGKVTISDTCALGGSSGVADGTLCWNATYGLLASLSSVWYTANWVQDSTGEIWYSGGYYNPLTSTAFKYSGSTLTVPQVYATTGYIGAGSISIDPDGTGAGAAYVLKPDTCTDGQVLTYTTAGTGITCETPATAPHSFINKSVEAPTSSENLTLGYFVDAKTIDRITCVSLGGTSVTLAFYSATTRNSGSPVTNLTSISCATGAGTTTTSLTSSAIASTSWLWFTSSGVSGSVAELAITVEYH